MDLKRASFILTPFVIAFVLVVTFRLLFITQYTLTSPGLEPTFQPGDRVLVNLTAYGVRMPFERLMGYHRGKNLRPDRNDWIAFYRPDDRQPVEDQRNVGIARCMALPGDTVWLNRRTRQYARRHAPGSFAMIIPAAGSKIAVTRENIRFLCLMLNKNEHCRATLRGDSVLLVNGQPQQKVKFSQDYYWAYSNTNTDSRHLGWIPASALIGKVFCISYSLDSAFPFYTPFRKGRFFLKVD